MNNREAGKRLDQIGVFRSVKNRMFFSQPPRTDSRRSGKYLSDPALMHAHERLCILLQIMLVWRRDACHRNQLARAACGANVPFAPTVAMVPQRLFSKCPM